MNFLRLIRTKSGSFVSASSEHEEELFLKDSAGILGSNFPNPDRVGCPDRLTLQRIASRKLPLKEISPWLKHLSSCSDCFRDVGQLRVDGLLLSLFNEERRQRRREQPVHADADKHQEHRNPSSRRRDGSSVAVRLTASTS